VLRLPSGGAVHVDGLPGAIPVLFLHGLGGGAWSWKPQRATLAHKRRLYVWEARGHGDGAPVKDAGLGDYYVDAREALAAVVEDARRPAYVVGHSMGALLALALACDVAAALAGLFLIEPAYASGNERALRLRLLPGKLAAPVLGPVAGTITHKFLHTLFARQFTNRGRMEEAWLDQARQIPFEYPQIFRESFAGPKGFRVRDFAKEIHDPTCLLRANSGLRIFRPAYKRLVRTLRENLGEDFHYESVPGGHYLQLDNPEIVNERLEGFLAVEECH
jgi:3-oxoadipate enol-lactonase